MSGGVGKRLEADWSILNGVEVKPELAAVVSNGLEKGARVVLVDGVYCVVVVDVVTASIGLENWFKELFVIGVFCILVVAAAVSIGLEKRLVVVVGVLCAVVLRPDNGEAIKLAVVTAGTAGVVFLEVDGVCVKEELSNLKGDTVDGLLKSFNGST